MASQELTVYKIKENEYTLINASEDYNKEEYPILTLLDLVTENEIESNYYDNIIKFVDKVELDKLLLVDFIFCNEDRHSKNIEWFDVGYQLEMIPIFDNGYSLCYDTLKGFITDYKDESRYCPANAFYSYHNAIPNLVGESNYRQSLFNSYISEREIKDVVDKIQEDYKNLVNNCKLNNIPIPDKYFNLMSEFIKWRIELLLEL
jgi:hypothetical protein